MINYYNNLIENINCWIDNKISLADLIDWANVTYNKFYNNSQYKKLKNRLVNDILIQIQEFEDVVENLEDLNDKEKDYVNKECKGFLNQLLGNINYIEVYKILYDESSSNRDLDVLFNSSYELLNNGEVLSNQLFKQVSSCIENHQCETRADIIISEILYSILLLNESAKNKRNEVLIGTLGMCKNKHNFKDELKYLNNLICAYKGKCEYRFTLVLNRNIVLYTNIFVLEK